ncbi:hypothetical protein [Nocardia sp. NPDC049707]|uniref:hypothetical protein n=1 Tax=Nocardia sp. NPDC049707 TaxID=3154735 RepID=UPI00344AB0E0
MNVNAVEAAPTKLARVWDKDFNLIHVFGPDEVFENGLPLDHPAAEFLSGTARNGGAAYLTTDENDSRRVERLDGIEIRRVDEAARLFAFWRE